MGQVAQLRRQDPCQLVVTQADFSYMAGRTIDP